MKMMVMRFGRDATAGVLATGVRCVCTRGALAGKPPVAHVAVAFVALGLSVAWTSPARAAEAAVVAKVREANAAYAAGDYEAALEAYTLAEIDCPQCPEIVYDRALVYYRMRDFTKARELFNAALSTRDLDLEARAKFNLGNVAYAEALEKLSDLPQAIEDARRAIYHYRDALDLDPEDADARANIEIAQLLIKDLLDKQKKQQEQEQQNQDQQKQDQQCDNPQEQQQQQQDQDQQDDEQQKDTQKQDQAGDEEQQEQRQEQEKQSAADEQEQEDQASQKSQDQQEQSAAQPREAGMTQEEAQRMLQAVRDKEAQRREERAHRIRARRVPVSRDW